MYKVLIVDDEILVRTHIKTLIKWEEMGFMICGEASNGMEALKFMETYGADILLSDIRMPLMDGLELAKNMSQQYPNVQLVMLSNYDDFEYVRGTLQHGAVDYILKHRLNEQVLCDMLQGLRDKLHVTTSNGNSAQGSIYPNVQALRQRFVVQLLSRYFKDEQEIAVHLKAQQLRLQLTKIVPIVMEVDDYLEVMLKRGLKEESLLQFAILNIVEEILNDNENGEIGHVSNGKFVVLLSFATVRSEASINQSIRSIVDQIDQCLKKFVKVTACISVGLISDRLMQVPDSYEKASKLLAEKFYLGKNCILYPNAKLASISDKLTGLDFSMEKELLAKIKLGDSRNVFRILDHIFDSIGKERLSLAASQMIFNELLAMVNRMCKENQLDAAQVYARIEPPHEIMAKLDTLREIKNWVEGVFERLLLHLHKDSNKNVSDHIKKACLYLQKHLQDNISLSLVAEEIGISSPYLSAVFKEEMGVGFSEYLLDIRLEKAKALLEEENLVLKEILSLCGFNNYTYFFNVFKRKVGLTPKEYIKLKKS